MAGDKTSYSQSLTHMIKGNLGAGLLGMGSSFAHLGLVGALVGLPALCLVSGYCVHLLIRSARRLEERHQGAAAAALGPMGQLQLQAQLQAQQLHRSEVDYPSLARRALQQGPEWARRLSKPLGRAVDIALLVTQVGVCCVYIVFVVDNVTSILASNRVHISKSTAFVATFPVCLLLSSIKTLNRLALASTAANLLQFVGLALIIEFLVRDLGQVDLRERDHFRPLAESALGFGSAMFAFEGISVVLPIYSRMRRPKLMASHCGVVNVSFLVILVLYLIVGLLSFLKYGRNVRDSITLNLPAEPLYDLVRAMFTASILLTYPLQFYVPNEMIWKWARRNLLQRPSVSVAAVAAAAGRVPSSKCFAQSVEIVLPKGEQRPADNKQQQAQAALQLDANSLLASNKEIELLATGGGGGQPRLSDDARRELKVDQLIKSIQQSAKEGGRMKRELDSELGCAQETQRPDKSLDKYQYYCRFIVVTITFTLAASVPRLNLLMDLIGSFSGAALSLTIPATIHLAVYWQDTRGLARGALLVCDSLIIVLSLCAGTSGSISSLASIIRGH